MTLLSRRHLTAQVSVSVLANDTSKNSCERLRSPLASVLAWFIPLAALYAGLLAPMAVRATVWIVALAWMGTSCILNARRCVFTRNSHTADYEQAFAEMRAIVFGERKMGQQQ